MRKQRGVTLLELLLVISILLILGTTSFTVGSGFLIRNALRTTTQELASNLRLAQLNSIASKEDRQWGVDVTSSEIRLFAVGDSSYDIVYDLPGSVSVNIGNVVFDNLTGNPNSTITFTLTSNIGDSNTISVNELGIVDVN